MLNKIVKILEKTNNVTRSSYFWNAASALILALQSPIILMVMTRTNGKYDAGIFSIGIAVGNLMMYVGQYGLRRFQSSDVNEQYKFRDYHGMRIISCAVMAAAVLAYCGFGSIFRGYSAEKFTVVFLIGMLKLIQAYSDVYHGHMQQKGRLDVATRCSTFRYIIEILVYCVVIWLTRDLVLATVICVAVSFVIMLLTSVNAGSHYCDTLRPAFNPSVIRSLLINGFPLFLSMFLNVYAGNCPRYAIDACLTDDIQAVFSYIFMPAFVIQIIAHFIFNPILTSYALLWNQNDKRSYARLMKLFRRQIYLVLGLLALALLVAATIGLPILSWLFGTDLGDYKAELCIIMYGGAMLAYSVYFSTVIAIIRAQNSLLVCYGIVSVMALLMSNRMVMAYGIRGASLLYAVIMTVLAVSLGIVVLYRFRLRRNENLNSK